MVKTIAAGVVVCAALSSLDAAPPGTKLPVPGRRTASAADNVRESFWVTNGPVNTMAVRGNALYVGGIFDRVGPASGGGVPLDATTGSLPSSFPKVAGDVLAVAPDGNGGWFIGGYFTTVGTLPRNNLAHIRADLTVADWDPGLASQDSVTALVVSGNTVYVAGYFVNIGGQPRNSIAALDATSGAATDWNPNCDGVVLALAQQGATVYVGGSFANIGGHSRANLAALDVTTGLAAAWSPNPDDMVLALAVGGSTVYAGGYFRNIGTQPRSGIAAVDAATGVSTEWDAHTDGFAAALVVSGSTIYAGGYFTEIGGQPRNSLAALNASTGLATTWNPQADLYSSFSALALSGSAIYVGGGFRNVGGQPRRYTAALDAASGLATAWNPNPSGPVTALAVDGATVFVGGGFSILGGLDRNNLAALDLTTGSATGWDPNAQGGNGVNPTEIYSLKIRENIVYVGGNFKTVGGQPRSHVAALDATSGLATPWDPNADRDRVTALELGESVVYIGGCFFEVGGQPRYGLAAVDYSTGMATPWNPITGYPYSAGFCSGGTLVESAGLVYSNPWDSGVSTFRLQAFDAATGVPSSWSPNEDRAAYAMLVTNDVVYVGGEFREIGGEARNKVAAVDASTGLATPWNPSVTSAISEGAVFALANGSSTIYAGGYFTHVGGQPRNLLAEIDAATGSVTAWDPNPFPSPLGAVYALAVSGSVVYAGGQFNTLGGLPQSNLAAIGPANTAPNCSGATAVTDVLWPPSHQLVPIEVQGVVDPDGDPLVITATGVTQDESTGSGNSCPNARIVGGRAQVRSERNGSGNGRVYEISFQAEDGQGGSCTGTVHVCVPHDRGSRSCTDDGQVENSLEDCGTRSK